MVGRARLVLLLRDSRRLEMEVGMMEKVCLCGFDLIMIFDGYISDFFVWIRYFS